MASVLALSGYIKSDVNMVIDALLKLYGSKPREIQLTLTGEPIKYPYPVMKLDGRKIAGLPISKSRFRYLEPIPHRKKILSVDAGAKILFNLGTAKIIVAKVVAGVWRGTWRTRTYGPVKRMTVVANLREAAEWLLRIELEAAISLAKGLGSNNYVLLDRPLTLSSRVSDHTRFIYNKLFSTNLSIVGVCKKSSIKVVTGESLLGYLNLLGEKIYRDMPWYYHPIFQLSKPPRWMRGTIAVAKFSGASIPLRLDIDWKTYEKYGVEHVLGELAYLQDTASPGYPYPLKAVHELSRISDNELEMDKLLLLEELRDSGLDKRLLSDARTAGFRKTYLWGEGI